MSRLEIIQDARASLDAEALVERWNSTYPDALATSRRAVAWCLEEVEGRNVALIYAMRVGWVAGFAIVSALEGEPYGWIDALAVEYGHRRSIVRAALIDSCEEWLRARGVASVRVGGGPRSLVRGARPEPQSSRFWIDCGYRDEASNECVDLALDVARYTPPTVPDIVAGVVRPAAPRDRDNVYALLDAVAHVRLAERPDLFMRASLAPLLLEGGRLSDLMLLWTHNGAQGMAQLIFRDSALPIEVAYPYTLPQPWGALALTTLADGLPPSALYLLLDASIRRLHNNGVNSCVALGVSSPDLYRHFGFRPYRRWRALLKPLPPGD